LGEDLVVLLELLALSIIITFIRSICELNYWKVILRPDGGTPLGAIEYNKFINGRFKSAAK
jgi:hypothetical protein